MTVPWTIGFMQGRLSPLVDGKIQAFPEGHWQDEFPAAQSIGLRLMEWTLDHNQLYGNPLLTLEGRSRILELGRQYEVAIESVTGDCFMQAPFHRNVGEKRERYLQDLVAVIEACGALGGGIVVVPLVDEGRISSSEEEAAFLAGIGIVEPALRRCGVRIAIESEYAPPELARFMDKLPADIVGVNYDIGNSAALGFDHRAEIAAYGARIFNVHVKDRKRGGGTVPLGAGDADIAGAIYEILACGYRGNFVLQTARAADGDHVGAAARYAAMVENLLSKTTDAA